MTDPRTPRVAGPPDPPPPARHVVEVEPSAELVKQMRGGALAAALSALQAELPKIRKAQTAEVEMKSGGRYSYSYADLTAVSEAVMPLLGRHGLAFTAWPTTVEGRFVLRYHLLHTSGESMAGEYPLSGGNAQAIGSAITYARRYCLCAVTGVSPDDDDDAAATHTAQAGQFPTVPTELANAREAVRGAWAFVHGEFVQSEAGDSYRNWSNGGSLTEATPADLRKFAAMLSNLPTTMAGSDPATQTDGGATPTRPGDSATPSAAAGAPPSPTGSGSSPGRGNDPEPPPETETREQMLTAGQRARIFANLGRLDVRGAAEQRSLLGEIIGHPIKSRNDLTVTEAALCIDHLEQRGVDVPRDEPLPEDQS